MVVTRVHKDNILQSNLTETDVDRTSPPTMTVRQDPAVPDSQTTHNTDEPFDQTWEAMKFIASDTYYIRSLTVAMKIDAIPSNPSDQMAIFLYTDNAGQPGTQLKAAVVNPRYGALYPALSARTIRIQLSSAQQLTSGTAYWIVVQKLAAPTGANVTFRIDNSTATGMWANSADGLTWNVENDKTGYFQLWSRNDHTIEVYNNQKSAIYAVSRHGRALWADCLWYYAIYGKSHNSKGVFGDSIAGDGVYGRSHLGKAGVFTRSGDEADVPLVELENTSAANTEDFLRMIKNLVNVFAITSDGQIHFEPDASGPKLKPIGGDLLVRNASDALIAQFLGGSQTLFLHNCNINTQLSAAKVQPYSTTADVIIVLKNDSYKIAFCKSDLSRLAAIDSSARLQIDPANNGPLLKHVSNHMELRNYLDTAYARLTCSACYNTGTVRTPEVTPYNTASHLDLVIRQSGYSVRFFLGVTQIGAVDDDGNIEQKSYTYGGAFRRKKYEASAVLAGASTVIHVNIPNGSKLIGHQWIVKVAITGGGGAATWSAVYSGGASQSICSGQAFSKNTKGHGFFDENAATAIASAEVDILITPDVGTFTGGEIVFVCLVEEIDDLTDFA